MQEVQILKHKQHKSNLKTLRITRPANFEFIPGQFVVLEDKVEGKLTRRSYSIASGAQQNYLDIYYSVEPKGFFTQHLAKKQEGESLKILGPFGQFTIKDQNRTCICIASGTGISPFIAVFKTLEDLSNFTLLLSVRTEQDISHQAELAEFEKRGLSLVIATTRSESENFLNRRFGREDIRLVVDTNNHYYLCGSTTFVKGMQAYLSELKVESEVIFKEKYGDIKA